MPSLFSYVVHRKTDLERNKANPMDPSRKANREAREKTLQYKSRQESLLDDELYEDKLTKLLTFIHGLEQTPAGVAELERRKKHFGDCQQIEGETSGQFYGRLRQWLDRTVPQKKSPRHAPRQTDE
jgi:hypothetical protein